MHAVTKSLLSFGTADKDLTKCFLACILHNKQLFGDVVIVEAVWTHITKLVYIQVVVAIGRLKDVRHLILVMKTLLCAPATTLPTLHALW